MTSELANAIVFAIVYDREIPAGADKADVAIIRKQIKEIEERGGSVEPIWEIEAPESPPSISERIRLEFARRNAR